VIHRPLVIAVVFLLLVFSSGLRAATPPDQLIRQTVEQLIDELTERKLELEHDRGQLYELVERVIVEHIAVDKVAKLVLARHWRKASLDQRIRFADEFKNLLIRTYASALFDYTGREQMDFRPLKMTGDERTAVVRTDVKLPGVRTFPVNYKFLRLGSDEWKIFDVTIDGISLVTIYRASYARIIQTSGLDSLILRLENKTAESR
jgi:phospholipid transport system substrate-binding protein